MIPPIRLENQFQNRKKKIGTKNFQGTSTSTNSHFDLEATQNENEIKPSSFQNMMDEVLPPQKEGNIDLNKLWKELPDTERNLIQNYSQENLQKYKSIIVQIAKLTLSKNVKVEMMKRNRSNQDQVVQSVIKVIDERLQKMVTLMHSPQNSAFTILRSIEEIRGLLINLSS